MIVFKKPRMGKSIMTRENTPDRLIRKLRRLSKEPVDQRLIEGTVYALEAHYNLGAKMEREPGVAEIITQMIGRLLKAFGRLAELKGQRTLDIACGSNTSKAPAILHINTPLRKKTIRQVATDGYTAQFEPWMCRMLLELGADPVGVDFGDLDQEAFEHYRVDLGQKGALDFLPARSFDALQDSRLFGSPEFTAQFPDKADRLIVAQEILREEQRLLKAGGIVIHSDAEQLLQ
jgi:hypothetical protein